MTRRLAALEARVPVALATGAEEAREELGARLDRLRANMLATGDLHEDEGGYLALPDGTRLADLGEVGAMGDRYRAQWRELAKAVVRCATDE